MNEIKEITKNIFFIKREDRKTSTYSLSMKIPVNKLKSIFILKVIEKIFNITPIASMRPDKWSHYTNTHGILLNTTISHGDLKNVMLNITLQTATPQHETYISMLCEFMKSSHIQECNEELIKQIIEETKNNISQTIENSLKELSENTSDYIKSKNGFFNPILLDFTAQDIIDEFKTIVKYSTKQIVISSASEQPCDVVHDINLMESEEQYDYNNEDGYNFTGSIINYTCPICEDKDSTSVELIFDTSNIDINKVRMVDCLLSDIIFYKLRVEKGLVYSIRVRSNQNISTMSICFESPKETYGIIIENITDIMKNVSINDIQGPLENIKKCVVNKLMGMVDNVDYEVKRTNNAFYNGVFNPTIEEHIDMVTKMTPEELLTIVEEISGKVQKIIYGGGNKK